MRKLMTGLWLAFALCAWTGGVLQAQDAASAAEEAAVAAEEMEEEGGDITAGEVSDEGGSGSIDKADTAWIMAATALVLFMTIPGLSLFYGGLVRSKNVLSVLMHCFFITCVMTIFWLVCGYSLALTEGCPFIGGFDRFFLKGLDPEAGDGIPESLLFMFQMTFVIITPALIVGAFCERMKFSAVVAFSLIWALLVYVPVCHMVWQEGGWLYKMGVIDLAGGIVVHITAGVAALVLCIKVGPRSGHLKEKMAPHNLPMCVMGTGMLWVGWFGFNGGSDLGASPDGVMAMLVTQVSAATAAIVWTSIEWFKNGKPSVLGGVTGAIAGLAAITPASGEVGPVGALCIGTVSGIVCWYFSVVLKNKFRYDDSLDVFGVHGVGGFVGTILVAIFAAEQFGGMKDASYSMGAQLGIQILAAFGVAGYTLIISVALAIGIEKTIGLRVDENDEREGLDVADHGEQAYNS